MSGEGQTEEHRSQIELTEEQRENVRKMLARFGLVGKNIPAPFGGISGNFFHGPETYKTCNFLSLGGPMAAIQPVWENFFSNHVADRVSSYNLPKLVCFAFPIPTCWPKPVE